MRMLLTLCLAQVLGAQGGADPWSGLRSGNPPDVPIALRLSDPHVFRQGEIIKAELTLPAFVPAPGSLPGERWQFTGMLLDPAAECGTVAKPCFLQSGGVGFGITNGPSGPSDLQKIALNSYLPSLPSGRYRVAALARQLVLASSGPSSTSYTYSNPPRYAVSGTVEVEIVAADAGWVRDTIAWSLATLNGPQPRDGAGYQAQRDAAQQLAFLNDPAAWTASLGVLPKEESVLLTGLARGRPQAAVCGLMQARVPAPAQSVSSSYLYYLADICAAAHLPPAPVRPPAGASRPVAIRGVLSTTPPPVAPAPPDPEMQAWLEKRRAYTEGVIANAAAVLAGSLASKQESARWDAMVTLLQRINQVRNNRPPEPDPAWIPLLTAVFVRDFASVEPARRQYLLDMYASTVDSPELVPLLESVLDSWKPGDYYEAARSALYALNRIDPARARVRILAELVKEKTWLDVQSLELLPPAAVPPMDDALIEALARAQLPEGWNSQLRMAAIARYATPAALRRIRAIYESQQDACQPELAAYFVRVDPEYADRIFHGHPWDMHAPLPRCTVQYFQRTPPLAMGPPLERYLAAYLMYADVYIKGTAARSLARYGSASALPPLWDAFRYFHEYWKGKKAELERLGEGVQLEVDLRDAIARGRAWLTTETDLRLIESLCISGRCAEETRRDLDSMQQPIRIEITAQPFGLSARVAQYFALESIAAVESKLAKFPRGTRFILWAPSGESARIAEEIRRFAVEKGLIVTMQ